MSPVPLIERYRERISLESGDPVISLNEGSTPLVEAPRLSEKVGARVWLKVEGANPSVAFPSSPLKPTTSGSIHYSRMVI